jgi:hypothetical protein
LSDGAMFDPAWSAALACRRRRARHRNFCKHSRRISQIAGRCLARSPLAHHGRGQPNFDAADQYSPATRTTAKHFIRTLSMNCLPRGIVKSSAGAGTIPSIRRASFSRFAAVASSSLESPTDPAPKIWREAVRALSSWRAVISHIGKLPFYH